MTLNVHCHGLVYKLLLVLVRIFHVLLPLWYFLNVLNFTYHDKFKNCEIVITCSTPWICLVLLLHINHDLLPCCTYLHAHPHTLYNAMLKNLCYNGMLHIMNTNLPYLLEANHVLLSYPENICC